MLVERYRAKPTRGPRHRAAGSPANSAQRYACFLVKMGLHCPLPVNPAIIANVIGDSHSVPICSFNDLPAAGADNSNPALTNKMLDHCR